jgi:PIN domain
MARKPKEIRELRVVLDTNALFTNLGDELVKHETIQLIEENKQHADLKVTWLMPEIVFEERLFQMRKHTVGLVQNLQKVETLLGHNLGLNKEILDSKILDVAKKQADSLGIQIVSLDESVVDWKKVASASVRREPPFDKGEKEKGFRDSLIGHTFLQIVNSSPKSASKCRIVLISGDQLLSEFVKNNIDGLSNVQVFDGLEELKGLINTLASQVDEAFVVELQKKARALFFINSQSTDALYFKEKIHEQIQENHSAELSRVPEGATSKANSGIFISPPRFVRKENQRVHWISRISFNFNAMRWTSTPPQIGAGLFSSNAIAPPNVNNLRSTLLTGGGGLPAIPTSEVLFAGKTLFDVHWSTTVNSKRLLSHPSIDSIEFVETTCEQQ